MTHSWQNSVYQGEKFNSVTHLVGAALAVSGLSILVTVAVLQGDAWKVLSFSIYGSTLVLLYGVSLDLFGRYSLVRLAGRTSSPALDVIYDLAREHICPD